MQARDGALRDLQHAVRLCSRSLDALARDTDSHSRTRDGQTGLLGKTVVDAGEVRVGESLGEGRGGEGRLVWCDSSSPDCSADGGAVADIRRVG